MLYTASLLDDTSLIKLQSRYVLSIRGNSYRKISTEDFACEEFVISLLRW